MVSIPTITNITGSTNANTNFTAFPIITAVFDQTNPNYPRTIQLNNSYLTLTAGANTAGITLAAILPSLVALNPALTWPPIITAQPSNTVNASPTASGSFAITATSEISITYQWQNSVNAGVSYSNLANAGVYSNVTTNTMNISNVDGLSSYLYRCVATNGSGSNTSAAGSLTTDPGGSAYVPASLATSLVHPTGTSFALTATGTPSFTYQWMVNTGGGYANITTAGTPVYSGYTSATLSFTTSAISMSGYLYRCVITNGSSVSAYSSVFTLTVT